MRAVIQRVSKAHITINSTSEKQIGAGLVVLVGIEEGDGLPDIEWLSGKICRLRIFDDTAGVMNRSIQDTGGAVMVVSQFTLHASTRKGNRPSYIRAAPPPVAIPIYDAFVEQMERLLQRQVVTGVFGASMSITLTNEGPVTIIIDTKNRA
jgi:D-tyrosyl-tRNA(Tyr) deacylase